MSSNGAFGETGQQLLKRDLELAVNIIPVELREKVWEHEEHMDLVELVLDFGRKPLARFPSGDFILSERLITDEDLADAVASVGHFDDSNRAGVEGTLHRISCIRDREDNIYGLTIRIGRALITETATLVERPLKEGKSILIIGPPGVGKTSAIRNFCRVLSEDCQRRVMIVDTSNEIGGPGRVPHHAVGTCRRMQVKQRSEQHNVLIEAVQNHMPEVIVVDEIGKTEECQAIRSIAQRGVQLFATTHGHTLERMIKDRVMRDLVGGVNDVTIGDVRARELGKDKKTVLERVEASCFEVIVEMAKRTRWRIHYKANDAVDAILKGSSPNAEIRYLDDDGNMVVERDEEEEECQGLTSVENNAPEDTVHESGQVWSADSQVQDDWGNDSTSAPVADTRDSSKDNYPTEQKEEEEKEEANPGNSLAVEEATRILDASSSLEVLQARSDASREELKENFKAVFQKVEKRKNEDKVVGQARSRTQQAYRELLVKFNDVIVHSEEDTKLTEAERILSASSDFEVLQVESGGTIEELQECFKAIVEKVAKADGEEGIVTEARSCVEQAYCRLLGWYEHERQLKKESDLRNARLKETNRILSASSDLEVLQVKDASSKEKLKERFKAVFQKIEKTPNEDETVAEARSRALHAYQALLNHHQNLLLQAEKDNILNEARRILLAPSKLEVLQARSSASKEEIKQCFKTVSEKIAKMDDEEQMVTTARDRLNRAYQELLAEHQQIEAQIQASKKAISKEAKRITEASSDLEVLQVKHNASREEIRKRFAEVNKKLPKTANEEETVTKARALVQESYEELIDWLVSENVNTLKEARLKEAKRITSTSSDFKILQVNSNYSLEELREKFNYIHTTIQKFPDEKDAMRKARTRLQAAYKRLRDSRS